MCKRNERNRNSWAVLSVLVLTVVFAMASVGVAAEGVPPLVDGYYQLSTEAHLSWFGGKVNAGSADIDARMTSDIDLSAVQWTPIGKLYNTDEKEHAAFSGEFDGQNYRITGLTLDASNGEEYLALFGYTRDATIKNLAVDVAIDYSSDDETATAVGFAAIVAQGRSTLIENCAASGTIKVTGYCVGGILGLGNETTVKNCSSSVDISAINHVGGIAGRLYDGTISDCVASGTIKGEDNVGGIVGNFASNDDDSPVAPSLKNSVFSGSVSGSLRIGGIAGRVAGARDPQDPAGHVYATIENCDVTSAKVEGSEEVGGIAGEAFSSRISDINIALDVSALKELGDTDSDSAGRWAGGIVGLNSSYSVIERCGYAGTVVAENGAAGGIAGHNYVAAIRNCMVQADVRSTANGTVGGITGRNEGGTVANCTVFGKVESTGENSGGAGGIVGLNVIYEHTDFELADTSVVNCTADADVSGGAAIGGIVGQNDTGSIRNCTADGTVRGERMVGGIVGFNVISTALQDDRPEPIDAPVVNSSSAAAITAEDDATLGGIVGQNGNENADGKPNGGTMRNNGWNAAGGASAFYGTWVSGVSADIAAVDDFSDVVTSYTFVFDGSHAVTDGGTKMLFRSYPGERAERIAGLDLSVSSNGLFATSDADNNVTMMAAKNGIYIVSVDLTLTATQFGEGEPETLALDGSDAPTLEARIIASGLGGDEPFVDPDEITEGQANIKLNDIVWGFVSDVMYRDDEIVLHFKDDRLAAYVGDAESFSVEAQWIVQSAAGAAYEVLPITGKVVLNDDGSFSLVLSNADVRMISGKRAAFALRFTPPLMGADPVVCNTSYIVWPEVRDENRPTHSSNSGCDAGFGAMALVCTGIACHMFRRR